MTTDSDREAFQHETGVSRETMSRMDHYAELLQKWNPAINLVSRTTLDAIWRRHFTDSAQVFNLAAPKGGLWADLGSGAGFPGLVVAILAAEMAPGLSVVLLESDARKAAFLATASREAGVKVRISTDRIEAEPALGAHYVSARALAPLPELLAYAERHLAPDGTAYFSKGKGWMGEIADARRNWRFEANAHPSKTEENAAILEVRGVARA
ncbi:MAG: 16S rRNA (guanine(527)-N(7))-methyltransferase RsmG [Rhodobacteraceae bacterium]|nr:16S rRNA (guanine(527)-N(7))-methyltransferase RsmG [Paracoccaceae bacterium]